MSVWGESIDALRAALRLTEDVKAMATTVADLAREMRGLDQRTTRLEARLDTIMDFATARRLPKE